MGKVRRTEQERILRRREEENGFGEVIDEKIRIYRHPLKKQKELKRKLRISKDKYTFLQYMPLIYLWATETKGILRKDLDILFYLHPIIVFRSEQIIQAQRSHGFHDPRMRGRFKAGGWITLYSTKPPNRIYYALTYKATALIIKIYRMLLMEETFPMDYTNNSLVARYDSKQDRKVMDTLNEFNRRVREKAENKT